MTPTSDDLAAAEAFERLRSRATRRGDIRLRDFVAAARSTDLPDRVKRLVGENERLRAALREIVDVMPPEWSVSDERTVIPINDIARKALEETT